MSSVFTKIINGDIPGRFVWSDDQCVGFLSINPLGPGHTLVVPREEVDEWLDASPELNEHIAGVARLIGRAIRDVWTPPRVGTMIAGFEVPHMHVHVFPAWDMTAFDFANAAADTDATEQDAHAESLRAALKGHGHGEFVPES
ncbi:HIT family protein [Pseudonocardia phyllosphaerae]|uniref:HIT family protein n=1 Tax=Pseudonocardia phyllosphaerae TaxID=3390502 RepID=UPI003978D8CE